MVGSSTGLPYLQANAGLSPVGHVRSTRVGDVIGRQPAIDHRISDEIDSIVAEAMQAQHVPGVAIAVTHSGAVTFERRYGVMSVESDAPTTPQTLFHLASVTKTFIGVALMQLAERGRLDLDAPVVTYLPYFRLADPRYREMTIAQMMSHTSGMPDTDDYG